jgi:rfaE bifunctional protein nucleotidyltransferase chain/domain
MGKLEKILAKIVPLEAAKSVVESYRASAKKIVFTNGCFDILHRGHVTYLAKAADLGDILVVAINTDQSVRQLGKGSDRPVNPEDARALVLAALDCVDVVVTFDQQTPFDIIETLVPDVLVKGGDYDPTEENSAASTYIVGREIVLQAGGEVQVVDLVDGFSTTALLKKISNK